LDGATTFSITAFGLMTLGIICPIEKVNRKYVNVMLSGH
jgi:hypothetical protein